MAELPVQHRGPDLKHAMSAAGRPAIRRFSSVFQATQQASTTTPVQVSTFLGKAAAMMEHLMTRQFVQQLEAVALEWGNLARQAFQSS